MSARTLSRFQLIKHELKKIPFAVFLWRLLSIKRSALAAQYYILRLIGHASYPLFGCRVPLSGCYEKTRDFLRNGSGEYVEFDQPCWNDNSVVSNEFKPEIFIAIIPKARALYHHGYVISPDHRLLADVSWVGQQDGVKPQSHPAMYKVRLPAIQHVPGRVAVISSVSHDNYYHWMFQILPRLDVIHRSGIVPDYYVVNANTAFQRESLEVLNIPADRILNPTNSTHIEADELIVPSLLEPVFIISPQPRACDFLRSKFLSKNRSQRSFRALYITRDDAPERRVLNEREILEEVIDNDFEVFSLSKLTFSDQVQLFSEAKIIVAPHGSGLANAVFCDSGSVLIEFMPEDRRVDCYERMARILGIEYYRIIGSKVGHLDDYTVNRAELRKLLR
jgi:hypothetical protein